MNKVTRKERYGSNLPEVNCIVLHQDLQQVQPFQQGVECRQGNHQELDEKIRRDLVYRK